VAAPRTTPRAAPRTASRTAAGAGARTLARPGTPPRPPARPPLGARVLALGDAALGGPLPGRLARWDTPAATYYVLQGSVVLLVALGLVMVLSSSSVESLADSGSPFAVGVGQAQFAVVGLAAMALAARVPVPAWRRLAPLLVLVAVALQAVVFSPLGVNVDGNRNWFRVAGVSAQPSEFGKLALALWCAAVLAGKQKVLDRPARWVLPLAVGAVPLVGLVLLGRDLGTTLVLLVIAAAACFVAGVPLRLLAVAAGAGAALVAAFVVTSSYRMGRVAEFLSSDVDAQGLGYQSQHGLWALASGGWTGLGLGGSRQKWEWLPAAQNDFIFAIIGEELGLLGAATVLFLFVVLAWACARVVRRSRNLFAKVAVGAVMAWVLGQAALNIAVVLGLFPVIGVPLPLISAGGSALVATLAGLGVVQACARDVPGARRALAARPGLVRRSLAVVPLPRGVR